MTEKHIFPTTAMALVCVLVLAGVALAQSGGQPSPSWYAVEQGGASGGRYHLISVSWQVSGAASGGGYRLLSASSPTLRGSGCCCTYIPCVLRNRQ
jgi:hypothetical protein